VFLPVKTYWSTPSLLSLARQVEVLPNSGSIQLPSSTTLDLIKLNQHIEIIYYFLFFQVAKRRKSLLNYMLFLRLTPTLPNTFINFASPIVDVPYHIFFLGTVIGLIPAAYVTVRVCAYQNNYNFVLWLLSNHELFKITGNLSQPHSFVSIN
jgi:hypothetical protein